MNAKEVHPKLYLKTISSVFYLWITIFRYCGAMDGGWGGIP